MTEVRDNDVLLTDQDKQILDPYFDDDFKYLPADMITDLNY